MLSSGFGAQSIKPLVVLMALLSAFVDAAKPVRVSILGTTHFRMPNHARHHPAQVTLADFAAFHLRGVIFNFDMLTIARTT